MMNEIAELKDPWIGLLIVALIWVTAMAALVRINW